jgi:hypothetical protein
LLAGANGLLTDDMSYGVFAMDINSGKVARSTSATIRFTLRSAVADWPSECHIGADQKPIQSGRRVLDRYFTPIRPSLVAGHDLTGGPIVSGEP